MLNDRDDKYEGHEESEYHFSDDEVHYEEPEAEAPKQASNTGEPKESVLKQFTRKRLVILGVFIVLIIVAYKMVTPTTSIPTTDITAQTSKEVINGGMPTQPAVVIQNVPEPATTISTSPATNTVAAITPPPTQQVVQPTQPVAQANTTPQQPVPSGLATSPAMQMAQQIVQQQQQQQPAVNPSQPITSAPTTPAGVVAAQQQAVTSLPAVIPVQSPPAPTAVSSQSVPPSMFGARVDEKLAALAAESQRISGQLQSQYTQKFDDFSSQNKVLKDQLQSLSERVNVMENQLNQLVQILTRRAQGSSSMNVPAAAPVAAPPPRAAEARMAYNVQAIIPGRAWLKSDAGETLTVAEGDVIKGIGRVTKIDPYDGIVEVNTGTKSISLSYGTGG
jgi:hypothetical protein